VGVKISFRKELLAAIFSVVLSTGFCQIAVVPADGKNVLRDTSIISSELLATLKTQYGKNKIYPAEMEKLVLYTLSFLPELAEHKITFKVRPKGAPLSSRPDWGTLWRSARKRRYMVFIHQGQDSSLFGSLFSRTSVPAKIGILGHELCHVSNFSRKTSMGLLGIGVAHISKPYMDRFEFNTDSLVIEKGMGRYLREWSGMFDAMFSGTGDPFKNKNTPTGERYMSAATIQRYMEKSAYPGYR
jgi:hypothetical protein